MIETLKLKPSHTSFGSGVYELGTNGLRVFVTNAGNVMAIEGRALTGDDLIQAYAWGRLEQEALWAQRNATAPVDGDDDADGDEI